MSLLKVTLTILAYIVGIVLLININQLNIKIMNFTNKLRLLFTAIILIGSSYAIGYNTNSIDTDLEIYTSTNIYYVNGLVLTNENTDLKITFNNQSELKDYLGTLTANEVVDYNCINMLRFEWENIDIYDNKEEGKDFYLWLKNR